MKIKSKCTILFSSLFFAGLSFAGDAAPTECPGISAIHSEGISAIYSIEDMYYSGYTISSYNTNYNWLFVLGQFPSDSKDKALRKANEVFPHLSGSPVPVRISGKWMCQYSGADEIGGAFAIHYDNMFSSQQLLSPFA